MRGLIISIICLFCASGCASEVPKCSSDYVKDTFKEMIATDIRESNERILRNDPDGIVEAFINELTVGLENVTNDSYDKEARKRDCTADLTTYPGYGGAIRVPYEVQAVEDKNEAIVSILKMYKISERPSRWAYASWISKRYTGEWVGEYKCDAISGGEEKHHAGFASTVTMKVNGAEAKLTRTTKGGGTENMSGEIRMINGGLELHGEGRNPGSDEWDVSFEGEFSERSYNAKGRLSARDGNGMVRYCSMSLLKK